MPINTLSNSLSCVEPFSKFDRFSIDFDGSNDIIDAGDTTIYDGLNDLSISTWVKVDGSASGVNPIVCKGGYNTNNASFNLRYHPTNSRISFSVERDSDESDGEGYYAYVNNNSSDVDGKWCHIAVVYSNTNDSIAIYVNGTSKTITASSGTFIAIPNSGSFFNIGGDSGNNFHGKISDVAMYNTDLSASQITSIYNNGNGYNHKTGVASANLIAWYRMGDGVFDFHPLIQDSTSSITFGSNLITNGTFHSNITGWSDYSSGTVSHNTSAINEDAKKGSLKCTFDGTDTWGGMQTDNISSVEANTLYLIEARVYMPDGFDGTSIKITDGASYAGAGNEESSPAFYSSGADKWLTTRTIFRTGSSDVTGKLYIRAGSTPSNTKFIYIDNITMRKVTGGTPGQTYNMTTTDFNEDTP